jgi:MFS family permease
MLPSKTPIEVNGFRALLKNQPFLYMWGGQVVSQIADKVFFVLLISILQDYHAPVSLQNSMRSLIMVAFTLPAVFFGAAAGIFVDRYPKKKIMVIGDVIRAFLTLLIPILPKEFILLLILVFLISTVTQLFAPAEQSAIPLVVPKQNLLTANALFTTTQMISLIVGFAIGEPILYAVRYIGVNGSEEIFVALLYFLAAFLGEMVKIDEKIDRPVYSKNVSFFPTEELKAGLRYLTTNRLVSSAMLELMILFSAIAALPVLAIELSAKIGLKETQFGFLVAGAGIGLVFGAAMLGQGGSKFQGKPLSLIGFISMAIVLVLFSFTKYVWLGLLLSGILGFGAALVAVPMQTLIQEQTPENMRGKVFGFQNNAVNIALSIPLAITGPLTDQFGLRSVLVTMSAIVFAVALWSWKHTRKLVRH